jgi:hypothetical protein
MSALGDSSKKKNPHPLPDRGMSKKYLPNENREKIKEIAESGCGIPGKISASFKEVDYEDPGSVILNGNIWDSGEGKE